MPHKLTVMALATLCTLTAGCTILRPRGAAGESDLLAHLSNPSGAAATGLSVQVDRNVLPPHTLDVTVFQGFQSAYALNDDEANPQIVVGSDIIIHAQGYEPGEEITTEFVAADGTSSIQQVTVDEGGFWTELWRLLPNSPIGMYTINIHSRSASESISFAVTQADAPFIRAICGPEQFDVYLFGFQPDEPVQLALYGGTNLALQSTWGVSAGSDGSVTTSVPNPGQSFGIVVARGADRPIELSDPIDGGSMQATAVEFANCP